MYLQSKPETCQDRIKQRNRHEEQSVPMVSREVHIQVFGNQENEQLYVPL